MRRGEGAEDEIHTQLQPDSPPQQDSNSQHTSFTDAPASAAASPIPASPSTVAPPAAREQEDQRRDQSAPQLSSAERMAWASSPSSSHMPQRDSGQHNLEPDGPSEQGRRAGSMAGGAPDQGGASPVKPSAPTPVAQPFRDGAQGDHDLPNDIAGSSELGAPAPPASLHLGAAGPLGGPNASLGSREGSHAPASSPGALLDVTEAGDNLGDQQASANTPQSSQTTAAAAGPTPAERARQAAIAAGSLSRRPWLQAAPAHPAPAIPHPPSEDWSAASAAPPLASTAHAPHDSPASMRRRGASAPHELAPSDVPPAASDQAAAAPGSEQAPAGWSAGLESAAAAAAEAAATAEEAGASAVDLLDDSAAGAAAIAAGDQAGSSALQAGGDTSESNGLAVLQPGALSADGASTSAATHADRSAAGGAPSQNAVHQQTTPSLMPELQAVLDRGQVQAEDMTADSLVRAGPHC